MNIVIIDDHKLFRIGLIEILRRKRTINVVAEYADAQEFLRQYQGNEAHLALIDIRLQEGDSPDGVDLAIEIRKRFLKMKTAMLTMSKDAATIKRALVANVDGYFNKDIDVEELIFGLKKIMQGGKYFTSAATDVLLWRSKEQPEMIASSPLTKREKQVLQFLVDGYSSQEMAKAMKIGKRTIDSYRASILGKFNMKNSSQLVKFIVEKRILEQDGQ